MELKELKSKLDSGTASVELVPGGQAEGINVEVPHRVKVTETRYDPSTGEETSPHEITWTKAIIEEKLATYQAQVDAMKELLKVFPKEK